MGISLRKVTVGMLASLVSRQAGAWVNHYSTGIARGGMNFKRLKRAPTSIFASSSTAPTAIAQLGDLTVPEWLAQQVQTAMGSAFGEEYATKDAMVTAATKAAKGSDYQCNAALPLAKLLGLKSPRDAATALLAELNLEGVCDEPSIAGPGFINLKLSDAFVEASLEAMRADPTRLGVPEAPTKQKVVVDFSSPNIAKEMHVGHLRSTIIGDTLSRVLEFRGHNVVRLNHVGDWGTQFGMLITYLRSEVPSALEEGGEMVDLGDLVVLYKKAKKKFDDDSEFAKESREAVVALQAGDPASIAAWKLLCAASRVEFQRIYDALGVTLEERGESFYNPQLASVVAELEALDLAVESDGALVVWLEGFKARDGESAQPLLVRKSDGGYMYATTDLAAVRQRTSMPIAEGGEEADRVLYVTDVGQGQHFAQVFQVAKRAGFLKEGASLEHVPFGLVQGEDGKKFATRSGETVKLADLLSEAVRLCEADLEARATGTSASDDENDDATMTADADTSADTSPEIDMAAVAKVVGLGAVKYADLAMNRESNYRFSYAKMLALNGNTAPYMLYAYARIQGIQRKAAATLAAEEAAKTTTSGNNDEIDVASQYAVTAQHPAEAALARQLLKLPEVVVKLEKDLYPNLLCDYLFETSQKFNQFYEQCPVNSAETQALRGSRAALCGLTADTLKLALGLLGIGTVDRL